MTKTPAWTVFAPESKVAMVVGGLPFMYRDTKEEIGQCEKFLREKFGLENSMPEAFQSAIDYYGMSDTPKERAKFIAKCLADPQIKLMFDGGGNGTDDVIEYLKKYQAEGKLMMRPDALMCAVSDGDQLLNYLGSIGAVSPIQGLPLLALSKDIKGAADRMQKFLFEQKIDDVGLQCFNGAARALESLEGKLVIFNGHSRRASYSAVVDERCGSILLLEATQQAGRRNVVEGLQFALNSMEEEGKRPKAILLSQSDTMHSFEQTEAIRKIAETSGIPIFSGAPFGHNKAIDAVPLPFHTDVKITVSGEDAKLEISAVRSLEDVAEVREICDSRAPYFVKPAPVDEAVISISAEPIEVIKVYDPRSELVGDEDREDSWVSRMKTGEARLGSWTEFVKGADSSEFLFARAVRICQRYEVTDLDCVDLSGKRVAIGFEGGSTYEEWLERDGMRNPPEARTKEDYSKHILSCSVQDAQTVLMELLKTGQLQKASSTTFLMSGEIPAGFGDWLKDFARGHELDQSFFVGKAPANVELFPDGPPIAKGSVALIEAKINIMESSEYSIGSR